jgi:Uma2 family endonuclease
MTAVATPADFRPPRHFGNAAEWLAALGDIPLERIIFDPLPGTATEADLLRFIERDKRLCELIDGTLVEKPVGWIEAIIAMNIGTLLNIYVQPQNLGVVSGPDSTLRMPSTGRVRLPDVAFILSSRLPAIRQSVPTIAPDLAVEVLSESNTPREMELKLREYFESGARLAWIVDPVARTVAVYHAPGEPIRVLNEADQLDGEPVLPGFAAPVVAVFRGVPASS